MTTAPRPEVPTGRTSSGHEASPPRAPRLGYVDWLRGLAILIMIQAHVLDSWTRAADRASVGFGHARILGGFGAPLFLFLAGVSVALAAAARLRRLQKDVPASGPSSAGLAWRASLAVQRRGWQVFLFAFLFRLQAWLLNPFSSPAQMLKVDILNIMGPAIVAAAALWGVARTTPGRLLAFGLATFATTVPSAWIRQTPYLAWLPDPIEAYLRPLPGKAWFCLFPWVGFLFAGALTGVLLERRRSASEDRVFHGRLAASGLALAGGAYAASYLPSPIPGAEFWTTSPSFFLLRTGILVAALGLVYFQQSWTPLTRIGRYHPMQRFGRSSLFVYWVHVEIVYGGITRSLHRSLSFAEAVAAFVVFTLMMYALAEAKDVLVARWRSRAVGREPRPTAAPPPPG